jgi:hypothetical protein
MTEIELTSNWQDVPRDIAIFLKDADQRAHDFVRRNPSQLRGFVPSDYVAVYRALRNIVERELACGERFCEWGSGLGVNAALAATLGFESYGIELDPDLFDASVELAQDYDIDVEFVHGSFVPPDAEQLIDQAAIVCEGEMSLSPFADRAYDELGFELRDFDVVFAFPWPNDELLTSMLFEQYAATGALLLTFSDLQSVRLRRK